ERCCRPQLRIADEGFERLARQSRRCWAHRAEGFSEEQQIPQPAERWQWQRWRGERRRVASRQLATKSSERSDFSSSAAAVSPKNSFSPGRRLTPITTRLCLRLAGHPCSRAAFRQGLACRRRTAT